MTSSKSEARERQRLQRLAAEYRTRGFDVHIAPSGKELPSFLQGFRPDMIAKKGDINVVIEVTAQESLKSQRGVQELATAVEGQRGWRFELVVTNPRPEPEVERASELVSERTITQRLASVEGLRTEGNWEAALLLTWTVFEAEMRRMWCLPFAGRHAKAEAPGHEKSLPCRDPPEFRLAKTTLSPAAWQ